MNATHELEPRQDGAHLRIGIVMSHCNRDTCENLLGACTSALGKRGVPRENITLFNVPGILELPLVLQAMARTGDYDALIALGSIVRGEKSFRFDVVCHTSAAGIAQVQLETGVPIANGVLMTEMEQHYGLSQAGEKAAATAIVMANLMQPFKRFPRTAPAEAIA